MKREESYALYGLFNYEGSLIYFYFLNTIQLYFFGQSQSFAHFSLEVLVFFLLLDTF